MDIFLFQMWNETILTGQPSHTSFLTCSLLFLLLLRYLCIVCSGATDAADGVENLKIDLRNSPTEKNPATDNDWVSFDWEVKPRLPLPSALSCPHIWLEIK